MPGEGEPPQGTSPEGLVGGEGTSSAEDGLDVPTGQGGPPQTQIKYGNLTNKFGSGVPLAKKDKRQSSSRFNITKNRELQKLPMLRGQFQVTYT